MPTKYLKEALPGISVSFEFFPPKTPEGAKRLDEAAGKLGDLSPDFMSVTYGAGGTTQDLTRDWVSRLRRSTGTPIAHHLTCVGAARPDVDNLARELWEDGIRHIVALRGDPPKGSGEYKPHPNGYAFAADLVEGLRKVADFDISVAAYPEVHPQASSASADLDNLKRKLDAGANRAITQYFFDNDQFYRFMDQAQAAGIDKDIVPGIMPVTNLQGLIKFSAGCGAIVPQWLIDLFDGLDDDPDTRSMIAASVAIEQCRDLYENGFRNFHFYTLNRADLSRAVCHALGVRNTVIKSAAE